MKVFEGSRQTKHTVFMDREQGLVKDPFKAVPGPHLLSFMVFKIIPIISKLVANQNHAVVLVPRDGIDSIGFDCIPRLYQQGNEIIILQVADRVQKIDDLELSHRAPTLERPSLGAALNLGLETMEWLQLAVPDGLPSC